MTDPWEPIGTIESRMSLRQICFNYRDAVLETGNKVEKGAWYMAAVEGEPLSLIVK